VAGGICGICVVLMEFSFCVRKREIELMCSYSSVHIGRLEKYVNAYSMCV